MMLLRTRLTSRLSLRDVKEICLLAQGESNNAIKDELYRLSLDADHRVAVNALWVFTHFTKEENTWLYAKHDELIDRTMSETDVTKRRLLMTLLLCQPFVEYDVRTCFIDFCLSKITASSQPYAIRALAIKLAYEQMRYWPELIDELLAVLDMLRQEPLSPGLTSAVRQVREKIRKQKR